MVKNINDRNKYNKKLFEEKFDVQVIGGAIEVPTDDKGRMNFEEVIEKYPNSYFKLHDRRNGAEEKLEFDLKKFGIEHAKALKKAINEFSDCSVIFCIVNQNSNKR